MSDATIPPGKGKANIVLPPVKKPKPNDFRNDFKQLQNQKNLRHNIPTVRRAGPRGG